jgi:hypothetical protein
MNYLPKLDNAIVDMEEQVALLKQNSGAIQKLSELILNFNKIVAVLEQSEKKIAELRDRTQTSMDSISLSQTTSLKQVDLSISEMIANNKRFAREVDDTITSKLERFGSEIHSTIRQERTAMQDILLIRIENELTNLKTSQELIQKSTKKTLMIMLGIVIVIGMTNIALLIE